MRAASSVAALLVGAAGAGATVSYWKARRTPPIGHEELLEFLRREGMMGDGR